MLSKASIPDGLRSINRVALALVTLALVAPAASATWSAYGTQEPDNRYDATGTYMWTAPPTATNQVYFNVIPTWETGPTPNSATLGSRLSTPGETQYVGYLGVWVDCNHDGYVGLADGALREYRAEASLAAGHPIDTTICPIVDETQTSNQGHVHYDAGGWVTELIPIGPSAPKLDARYIQDADVKMWGDFGAPETPTTDPAPNTCAQTSYTLAPGEASHTGGILHHLDCLDGNAAQGQYNNVVTAAPAVGGVVPPPNQAYGPGGPLDLPTFGNDNSQNSFVAGEQNCGSPPLLKFNTLNSTLVSRWPKSAPYPFQFTDKEGIRAPGTPRVNANGNVPGTVNETHEETPGGSVIGTSFGDDCDTTDDGGRDFYGRLETGSEIAADHKTSPDMVFGFNRFNNRYGCTGTSRNVCGMPNDGGVPEVANLEGLEAGDYWTSGVIYVPTAPDATGGTGTSKQAFVYPDVSPAGFATFYAHIGASDLATPGVGTYGSEFCTNGTGTNAPTTHGWDCNPGDWGGVAVGTQFEIRDVDCVDNTLVSAASSPTHADVGPRSAGPLTDPSHGCW